MRNNFGKRYFMHIPFSFRKKIEKTVKSDQQEPPKCGSTRGGAMGGDEGFLPHDKKTVLNTFMQLNLGYQFFLFQSTNLPGL